MHNATLIFTAAGLVVLAGLFAMSDAAVSTVSPARASELVREKVRGARALQAIAAELPSRVHPEALLVLGDPAEELAKVKDRLAQLQNDQKAARQMYDAACMRLGIPNDLEEAETQG